MKGVSMAEFQIDQGKRVEWAHSRHKLCPVCKVTIQNDSRFCLACFNRIIGLARRAYDRLQMGEALDDRDAILVFCKRRQRGDYEAESSVV